MDVTCTCGVTFQAKSPRAKYCSDRCRKRRQRGGQVVALNVEPVSDVPAKGGVEVATIRELELAERLDSALGQACVTLARRLDSPGVDTGSAVAAVAGRLESMLAAATKGAAKSTSPQQLRDELAARRAKHA